MTGLKKVTYDYTRINGTIIELEQKKVKITKDYKGKRQPELRTIADNLGIPLNKNIKRATVFIEIEYE